MAPPAPHRALRSVRGIGCAPGDRGVGVSWAPRLQTQAHALPVPLITMGSWCSAAKPAIRDMMVCLEGYDVRGPRSARRRRSLLGIGQIAPTGASAGRAEEPSRRGFLRRPAELSRPAQPGLVRRRGSYSRSCWSRSRPTGARCWPAALRISRSNHSMRSSPASAPSSRSTHPPKTPSPPSA